LIAGFEANINSGLSITGGMCGDDAFWKTLLYKEDPRVDFSSVLYGSSLEVSYASLVVGFHLVRA
jgi:hypothetical protein